MPQGNQNLREANEIPSAIMRYLATCQRALGDLLNSILGIIKENCADCDMKKDCPPFFIYAEAYRVMLMFLIEFIARHGVNEELAKDEKALALIKCEMCRQVTETNSFLFAMEKCMEPLINEGDLLIIKRKLQPEELREGDIIVYPSFRWLQGGKVPICVVHKITKIEGNRFFLTDTSGHKESVEKHLVCGKVVKTIEKGSSLWKEFSQAISM
ncbi:MAG: S24/S26 family peptidase [Nitrososphaerales archaeon]